MVNDHLIVSVDLVYGLQQVVQESGVVVFVANKTQDDLICDSLVFKCFIWHRVEMVEDYLLVVRSDLVSWVMTVQESLAIWLLWN